MMVLTEAAAAFLTPPDVGARWVNGPHDPVMLSFEPKPFGTWTERWIRDELIGPPETWPENQRKGRGRSGHEQG